MSIPVAAGSYNGWSWGGAGSPYRVMAATGFQDLPQLRRRAVPRSQADGLARSKYRLDEHVLQVTLHVIPVTGITVDQSVRTLIAATPRTYDVANTLLFDNSTKMASAYVANRAIVPGAKDTYARAVVQFELADPKIYENPANTVVSSIGNTISVNNLGNDRAAFTVSIAGVCVNPVVTNNTAGLAVKVPITMISTDTLAIDFGLLTCTLNGVRVSETTASDWSLLAPGTNSISFSADSGTAPATLIFRSAWS